MKYVQSQLDAVLGSDMQNLYYWTASGALPLTGRAGEVVEALSHRKVDVACIQKT